MLLPCKHDPAAVQQVQPAIDLLTKLDSRHPEVLKAHGLSPEDYHPKLVFRSAVESIRGTYIASSLTGRQGLVANVLEAMKWAGLIQDYQLQAPVRRADFQVLSSKAPRFMSAVEVKGGEGNSINISVRPLWANEFILWCHLDGAIVNQPSHGAAAIIFNRVAGEMVRRGKHVDAIVFKDSRCHSPLRPCPKYTDRSPHETLGVAPDIFLLPQAVPSEEDPSPPPHDLSTTRLPALILTAYGVPEAEFNRHLWQVTISLVKDSTGELLRETKVYHMGKLIESRKTAR